MLLRLIHRSAIYFSLLSGLFLRIEALAIRPKQLKSLKLKLNRKPPKPERPVWRLDGLIIIDPEDAG